MIMKLLTRTCTLQLLLISFTIVTATKIEQRSIQGGLNLDTVFYCSTSNLDEWTFTDQSGSHEINHISNVSPNGDALNIYNIVSYHEGVYRCFYGNSMVDIFNLTVLAVPQFPGCSPVSNCSLNEKINVTEGQSIPVTMSLQFVNGGARGLNQSIQYLRFKTSTLPFVISCFNSGSCSTTGSRPVSYYRSTNDPWNISFNISNATLQDTNTYYVEAGVINPSITNEIHTITSTVTINIIPTTTQISSTLTQISSTAIPSFSSSSYYSALSIETSTEMSSTKIPTSITVFTTSNSVDRPSTYTSLRHFSTYSIIKPATSTSDSPIATSKPIQTLLPVAITIPVLVIIATIFVLVFLLLVSAYFFRKTNAVPMIIKIENATTTVVNMKEMYSNSNGEQGHSNIQTSNNVCADNPLSLIPESKL